MLLLFVVLVLDLLALGRAAYLYREARRTPGRGRGTILVVVLLLAVILVVVLGALLAGA